MKVKQETKEKLLEGFHVLYGYAMSWLLGFVWMIIQSIINPKAMLFGDSLMWWLLGSYLLGTILIHPFILTMTNILHLFIRTTVADIMRTEKVAEAITIFKGFCLTYILSFMSLGGNDNDLTKWLYENQDEAFSWFWVLILIAGLSYLCLRYVKPRQENIYLHRGACGVMLLGIILSAIWIVYIFELEFEHIYLCLWPLNCILIAVKLLWQRWLDWLEGK